MVLNQIKSVIDVDPFFMFDPKTSSQHKKYTPFNLIICHSITGNGVQILSIDNLPAELAVESSKHFSSCLIPIIKDLVNRCKDMY